MSISSPNTGLDLERELTCSICTDILYQPLTLLNCLHTFCGTCLKEWFSWQAAASRQKRRQEGWSSPRYLYTCPSCRASVRETRPNSTVTTLLEMYLKANPEKGKTEDEKTEIAKHFTQGENVLPTPPSPSPAARSRRREPSSDENEDRRLMEEVRQMSLRELERRGTRTSRGEGDRRRDERNRRRDQILRTAPSARGLAPTAPQNHGGAGQSLGPAEQEQQDTRSLEHQSSLRSLINTSDLHSPEEIMQQMMDEGLLDDVDLSNVDPNDEEQISDLIAQAYRQRLRDREREREARASRDEADRAGDNSRDAEIARASSRYLGVPGSPGHISNEHRSASRGSGSSAEASPRARNSSANASRRMATSSPVLSNHGRKNESQVIKRQQSNSHDLASAAISPEDPSLGDGTRANIMRASLVTNSAPNGIMAQPMPDRSLEGPRSSDNYQSNTGIFANNNIRNLADNTQAPIILAAAGPNSENSSLPVVAPFRYCSSCSRPRIQHDIHYICSKCPATTGSDIFALCQRCYRLSKGCLHWFGFGLTAWARFRQRFTENNQAEPPHTLKPERYVKIPGSDFDGEVKCYHQMGVFCDSCGVNANACYWQCNSCNEGEWGFCKLCVNQARHCTHPLLPLALESPSAEPSNQVSSQWQLIPIPVHTTCNICDHPIPPSNTRFHCTSCNDGDYDICKSCYHGLVSSGKISDQKGPKGWRECVQGHRMLIVGFESRTGGQHRVVLESVIGGWQLAEEDQRNSKSSAEAAVVDSDRSNTTNNTSHWSWRDVTSGDWRYRPQPWAQRSPDSSAAMDAGQPLRLPPPGGSGSRMTALWTWLPDEGIGDELMFPKWAEVTEVLEINEDWCWGVYCRKSGLFPRAYARIL